MSTWRDSAACLGSDTELFYLPDEGGRPPANRVRPPHPAAAAYCRTCPVKNECLEDALNTHDNHGVRGGLTAEQRTGLRKRMRAKERAEGVAS
jgi:WhiB family redox-sensing transcriptional regulator